MVLGSASPCCVLSCALLYFEKYVDLRVCPALASRWRRHPQQLETICSGQQSARLSVADCRAHGVLLCQREPDSPPSQKCLMTLLQITLCVLPSERMCKQRGGWINLSLDAGWTSSGAHRVWVTDPVQQPLPSLESWHRAIPVGILRSLSASACLPECHMDPLVLG